MAGVNDTRVDQIADGIWRVTVAIRGHLAGGFCYCSFLIDDERPLLYHTGKRSNFHMLRSAIEQVMPISRLKYVSFAHGEADECGAVEDVMAAAPECAVVTNKLGRLIHFDDRNLRAIHEMADGDVLSLGRHAVKWIDTPHMPHCWESAMMFETTTRTLFCGDLLTQAGADGAPLRHDPTIVEETEAARRKMPYVSNPRGARPILERLAEEAPTTLAVMHGSSFRGDGAAILRALADSWEANG